MATLTSNGRDIHYTDTYTDSGGDLPPVLLAHGYFLDKDMFRAQARDLCHQYRIIAWDARGHGGTADDGTPFTYWDSASDLLGLMDGLGIDTAVCGGVSQGGFIALRAALLAPERIRALLLFDTEADALDPQTRAGYLALFKALAEQGPVDELAVPLSRQLIGEHPAADEWIAKWRAADRLPLGAPVGCLIDRDDIVDRLADITCPAFLARGSLDASLPAERLDTLRDRLPGATTVHTIQGAWHSPPLTHPDQVNPLLTTFLQGLPHQ